MKKNNYRLLAGSLGAILAWVNAGSVTLAQEPESRSVILREGAKLSVAQQDESGRALALASADFDEDGVPDLIASYAGAQGGKVSVRRGNVDAIYPNSPEAQARKANGQFTNAPFLDEVRNFALPEAAEFIGAGDFDADGHWDIVAAHSGGSKLYWLRGDGRGSFSRVESVELDGAVTALVVGEINRADGLTDIAVGLVGEGGARALVFESPNGALRGAPENFNLAAPASALVLGQLDDDQTPDLAIASGNEVLTVHGRDRKLSLGTEQRGDVKTAQMSRRVFESAVTSIAVGDFAGDSQQELAALTADGSVRVLERATAAQKGASKSATQLQASDGMKLRVAANAPGRTSPMRLLAAKVSSLPKDDLVVFGGSNGVRVVTTREADAFDAAGKLTKPGSARMSVAASVAADGEVISVLPMRLNADALKDLVVLNQSTDTPSVIMTQAAATYVVNVTGNTDDVNPGNGVCQDSAGNCTFSAAIQEANAHAGADTIEFNIPGAGPHTVSPNFAQVFNDATTVDGTTQPGSRIEVIGNGILPFEFTSNSSNSVVRGVAAYSFGQSAFTIRTAGNIIEGNYIGLRADGSAPTGDRTNNGIIFPGGSNNFVGGTTAAARNVISNCQTAVYMQGVSGNTIRGNYIGTNVAGTAAIPNFSNAIRDTQATGLTIGGTEPGAGNLISGNNDNGGGAISIENATSAIVQGNFIGTTADGTQPLSNSGFGIGVYGPAGPVTIGGTTSAARNVIAANSNGIVIPQENAGANTLVQGNFIGTNSAGTGALPNLSYGIDTRGPLNVTIGGTASGAGNLISGNGVAGIGLRGGINGVPTRAVVQGNLIGTDVNGVVAIPNTRDGIELAASSGSVIGGTSAEARNIISGNRENGVRIADGPNRVEGNYIGLNRFGTGALGNTLHGVAVENPQLPNTVGGAASGAGNTIAFNGAAGIASLNGRLLFLRILSNSIFSNSEIGIDQYDDGVTPHPGNATQYPVLNSVSSTDSDTTITGTLTTYTFGPQTPHTIQFFSSSSSDPSGHGEGQTFVGQTTLTAGSNANVPFSVTISPAIPPGRYISAVTIGQRDINDPNSTYSSEFSFCARVAGESTPENTPLHLNLITQNTGGNTGSTSTTIIGEGIIQGATVLLRRAGYADIMGIVSLISSDGSTLEVSFDLTSGALGLWDIVVMNPGGSTFTLPGVFTIESGRAAEVWLDILGRDVIRFNRAARYTIVYGNRANTDAYMVPLWIAGIPKDAIVTLSFDLGQVPIPEIAGAIDPNQISPIIKTDTEQMLPLLIPVVPAGAVRTLQFTIDVPNGTPDFTLRSWVSPALVKSIAQSSTLSRRLQANDSIVTSDEGIECMNALFQAAVNCALSVVPGADCAKGLINYVSNTVALNTGGDDALGWAQFSGGAVQLMNCAAKEAPGLGQLLDALSCGASFYSAAKTCRDGIERKYPVRPVESRDPNDKVGLHGPGPEHFTTGAATMPYSVFFENQATATAPAQEVVITDQLDVSKLDLDTFELGAVSFGQNIVVSPPPGLSEWTKDIDLRPQQNLIVRLVAALNRTTGVVTWHFFSLDPATMQPTEDPLVGFLPPNQNPPEGDGAVTFSIDPYPNQPFGTQITNQARIIFDTNAPIDTPFWLNTIDNSLPASNVSALAGAQTSRRFQVDWSGADTGAGVAAYTIYVSENGGPYTIWLSNTPDTTAIYDGLPNSSYAFYSIAEDGAGNLEELPASADASTTTPSSASVQLVSVESTKRHGDAGWFDVELPLTGNPGIECRSGGTDGDYILVFTFANALTRVDGVSVSTGTDTFNGSAIGPDARQYFVHLTGVASGQLLEVTLDGAGDEAGNYSDAVQGTMRVLVGDTNEDTLVNSADISQVKSQSGQAVATSNFQEDLTVDGFINSADISLVKSRSGGP